MSDLRTVPAGTRTGRPARRVRLRRAVISGVAAAVTTGVSSAVVTRALMRVVALLLREPTSFSLAGSAGIGLVYTIALMPGCIAVAATARRWAKVTMGAGAVLLMFEAMNIGIQETAAAHDVSAGRGIGVGVVLAVMIGAYALQVYVALQWSQRASRRQHR